MSNIFSRISKKLDKIHPNISNIVNRYIDDIKNSNKIFIFGSPHSGKSTFLASLVYFLEKDENHILRVDPVRNPEGALIIREITNNIKKGIFPEPTHPNFWNNILIEYHKNKDYDYLFKYSFPEVPGEKSERFDPTNPEHSKIEDNLKRFLIKSNGIIIIAPSIPEGLEPDIIRDFIEYLNRKSYSKRVLLLLTKFDEVEDKYEDYVEATKDIYRSAFDLLKISKRNSLLPFSIGKIDKEELFINNNLDTNNEYVIKRKIKENNIDQYMPAIVEWMESFS